MTFQQPGMTHQPPPSSGPPTAELPSPATGPTHHMPRPPVAVTLFAAASLVAVAIGISIPEDGQNAWHNVKAWGAVALIAAALTFAPSVWSAVRLTAYQAWQLAVGGAAGLALYWVLFVLPDIAKNTSLITTLGVAAGIVVAWIAPGRHPSGTQRPGSTW